MISAYPLFRQRLIYPFIFALFLAALLLCSFSITTHPLSAAEEENAGATFDVVGKSPAPSAFQTVILSTTVQATFNGDADQSTLSGNLVIHSEQQGRVNGGVSYDSGTKTVTFTPNRRFHFGEAVTVIATAGIQNTTGDPLTPTQWRFTPGHVDTTRCVEGFLAYEDDFIPVWASATDWGDYDGDGDLDAVIAGKTVGNPATFIYRNEGISDETGMSTFSRLNAGLTNVRDASVDWGDYDNDGDLDILLTGADTFGQKVSHIYRNNGNGSFTNINAGLTPVSLGGATWVDYNTDGRLDIFLHGESNGGRLTRLYRNDGNNTFTELPLTLPGVNNSSVDWADYDNDGDPDLLLTGDGVAGFVTAIYNNDNGSFVNINAGLPSVRDSSVAWGDYNGDGFEDILLSGENSTGASAPVTRIYRNEGNGTFTNINAGLEGILDGSVAWGDFDNDGDLDVLVGGQDAAAEVSTTLYENQGGTFVVFPTNLPAISLGSLTFGDVDGDFDADILLTGLTDTSIVAGVFRNYDCPADVAITQRMVPTYTTTSETVTVTLSFTNLGPVTATHVVIEDLIPTSLNNLQVVSTTNAPHVQITDSGATPPYRWNVSNLNVGDGGVITVTGILFPQFGQIYTNTARIRAAEDVTLTNNIARQRLTVPFAVIETTPPSAQVGVPLDQQMSIVFGANIDADTVDDDSLRLYGSHSGYLGQINTSYNAGSQTYRLSAQRPFVHGETLTFVATERVKSPPGAPLLPYQWQFTAGETSNRCVGDFAPRQLAGGNGLPGLEHGSAAWGDYDSDGDPDLLLVGQSAQGIISRLYRNDDGVLTNTGAPLAGVRDGAAQWVDDDGDGDLDIFLTGTNGSNPVAQLYRNTNGSFAPVGTAITPVANSMAAWGDYDNDGDLDLLLSGRSSGGLITHLYRNNGGASFTNRNLGLPGLEQGAVAWADYDGDHDIDLLLTGNNGSGPFAALYRNESNSFTGDHFVNSGISLTGVDQSAVAWADYDKDGDYDLLLTGNSSGGPVTELYTNNGGNLTTVATTLPALSNGSVMWGDYDNDGILDLLFAGLTGGGRVATIYRQQGGAFTAYAAALTGVDNSTVAWGDYDRDDDLDLILLGNNGSGLVTQIYRNTDCISDVGITKTVTPAVAVAGDVVTYTLTFSNAGPQPALDVELTDVIPEDLLNVQSEISPIGTGVVITETGNPGIKQWQVSDLAVGEGGVITLTAEVVAGAPGALFNNVVTIFATHDITFTNNNASAGVGRPFHITATLPAQAATSFPVAGVISATFDADVNSASASAQTVKIYGAQSGMRDATVDYNALQRTLRLTPTLPLRYGEAVNVIGTAALQSAAGAPLQPYQWHFTAGTVDPERCLAGFDARTTPILALAKSSVAWGDYDRDGDLDLLMSGSLDGTNPTTKLYRNEGNNSFTDLPTTLGSVHSGAVAWGDYDGDGDLDVVLTGSGAGGPVAKLYRNDNGTFVDTNAALTGVTNSTLAWGDYDNDGDLDLFISGTVDGTNGVTRLYRNTNGTFAAQTTPFANVQRGSVMWGDYDNDGDLDLLLTGTTDGAAVVSRIYRNDGTLGFADSGVALPGIQRGKAIWGDYDNDTDLDIFLVGETTGGTRVARLYRNNGNGSFGDVTGSIGFAAVNQASAEWGDYDNDGDLDLLISGTTDGTTPRTQVMINQGANSFLQENGFSFANIYNGVASWADYDGDRDLDILVTGNSTTGTTRALYQSRDCVSNLGIVKRASRNEVLPGEFFTYTLSFSNTGPEQATRVVISDLIPVDLLTDLTVQSTLSLSQEPGAPYVWRLPNIPTGQGGTITIKGRPTFAATGRTITNTASIDAREDVTPTNDVASAVVAVRSPIINFTDANLTVNENAGTATIQVVLGAPNLAGAVTVLYQSSQGTAQPVNDYTAVSGQVSIPAGQVVGSFTIPLNDDALDEEDETILLTLSSPAGAHLGSVAQATLTIVDNDPTPTLGANSVTVDEAAGVMNFVFTLSAASGRQVSFTVSTIDGTATAPADYIALVNQPFVIPPGSTSVTVPVTIVDNASKEPQEQFSLAVTPVNATMTTGQIRGTINDNDDFSIYLPIVNR